MDEFGTENSTENNDESSQYDQINKFGFKPNKESERCSLYTFCKNDDHTITVTLSRQAFYPPVFIVIIGILVSVFLSCYNQLNNEELILRKVNKLGSEAVEIFLKFDKNGDLHLSLEEAEALLLKFVNTSQVNIYTQQKK